MKKLINISIFLIGIAIYLYPLIQHLQFENAITNLNSDNVIFSLMAEDILYHHKFPIFFWGQNYMGPFTSILIAITQSILNFFHLFTPPNFYSNLKIFPQAPIIAASFSILIGHYFYYLGSKKFLNNFQSTILFFLLCSTHFVFLDAMTRPLGQEMGYLFSSLCFYFGLNAHNTSKTKQYFFAILIGISWWMNQNVVFILTALAIYYFSNQEDIIEFSLKNFDLKNRIFGQRHNLNWIKYLNFLLLIPITIGTLTLFPGSINYTNGAFHLKINNGLDYIKTPFAVFLLIQFILDYLHFSEFKKFIHSLINKYYFFVIGILCGYSPVLMGKLFKWYSKSYTPELKLVPIFDLFKYIKILALDFYPKFLFSNLYPLAYIFYLFICYLLFACRKNIKSIISKKSIEFNQIPLVSLLIFIFFSISVNRMRTELTFRYTITLIPILFICLLQLKNRILSNVAYLFIILITLTSFHNTYINLNLLTKENSQTQELEYLYAQNINYCYADYWDVYRLKYLSGGKLDFIPKNSQDRTPERTSNIQKSNLISCEYDKTTKKLIKL